MASEEVDADQGDSPAWRSSADPRVRPRRLRRSIQSFPSGSGGPRRGHQIDPTKPSKATDALNERLGAIHPDLTWQFGAGEGSHHCLTVSSGGVAQVRPLAERWLRAAPRPDETWEFRSSQQRDPNALTNVLEIAGHRLDLSDTRFHVESDADDLRIHVGVHHPAYASLSEEVRGQVTFLLLDWLLGEDDVERWVGHVESLTEAPAGLVTGREVVAALSDIAVRREPDEWTMGQWEDRDGAPGFCDVPQGCPVDRPSDAGPASGVVVGVRGAGQRTAGGLDGAGPTEACRERA